MESVIDEIRNILALPINPIPDEEGRRLTALADAALKAVEGSLITGGREAERSIADVSAIWNLLNTEIRPRLLIGGAKWVAPVYVTDFNNLLEGLQVDPGLMLQRGSALHAVENLKEHNGTYRTELQIALNSFSPFKEQLFSIRRIYRMCIELEEGIKRSVQ